MLKELVNLFITKEMLMVLENMVRLMTCNLNMQLEKLMEDFKTFNKEQFLIIIILRF